MTDAAQGRGHIRKIPRAHVITITSTLFTHSPLVYPFEAIKPHYKCCSFIKSCGKPTIASTTMKERHDNDEIDPHNHNEYPLLYKEAEILKSSLGRFLECRKWNILVITWALGIFLIYARALGPAALGNPSCPCYNYYLYIHLLVIAFLMAWRWP